MMLPYGVTAPLGWGVTSFGVVVTQKSSCGADLVYHATDPLLEDMLMLPKLGRFHRKP